MTVATDGWSVSRLPDLSGRTAVVTGCSPGGVGIHVATGLARAGAHVVLAGRRPAALAASEAVIRADVPDAVLSRLDMDLADLDAVRRAAKVAASLGPLHLLINNAGCMSARQRRTSDGFEVTFATNHLGPFLLTGLLLPQLIDSGFGRVVVTASIMHRLVRRLPLDDPRAPQTSYSLWRDYARSKLANLLFTFELDERLRAAGVPVSALAAHPGIAGSHLGSNALFGTSCGTPASIIDGAVRALAQPVAVGALPLLMAATADLPGGSYCGPGGPGETRGAPALVGSSALAHDPVVRRRLWQISERAVGLHYP